MIGEFDVEAINPPIWTLVHEARLSLLFPLIYLAVAKGGRRNLDCRYLFDVGDFDRGIGRTGVGVLSGDREAVQGRITQGAIGTGE
jgi:hypothetical protein